MSTIATCAILWMISLSALLWGAVSDWRERMIPDRVSLLVAACGLMLAYALRPADMSASLLAFVLVFAGMCALAYFDIVGGGDVKLISAVSLLVPSGAVMILLLEIALAGGLLSCAYLVMRVRLRREIVSPGQQVAAAPSPAGPDHLRLEAIRIVADEPMPYALAILGGVLIHGARELYRCHSAISCSF